MKHVAKIQVEFVKEARKWDELTSDEQHEYLKKHRKSRKRLTAIRPFSEWITGRKFIDLQTNKHTDFNELPKEQQDKIEQAYNTQIGKIKGEAESMAKSHFEDKENKKEERQSVKQKREQEKKQKREQELASGVKRIKMSPEEKEAAGHYFGWENLGMMHQNEKNELEPLIKSGDWEKITNKIETYATENAEDDNAHDGMLKEIKHWVRLVKGDNDTRKLWKERKEELGIVEEEKPAKEKVKRVKKNYIVMGAHPGDGSVQIAKSPIAALAKHVRLDTPETPLKEIIRDIKKDIKSGQTEIDGDMIGGYEVREQTVAPKIDDEKVISDVVNKSTDMSAGEVKNIVQDTFTPNLGELDKFFTDLKGKIDYDDENAQSVTVTGLVKKEWVDKYFGNIDSKDIEKQLSSSRESGAGQEYSRSYLTLKPKDNENMQFIISTSSGLDI